MRVKEIAAKCAEYQVDLTFNSLFEMRCRRHQSRALRDFTAFNSLFEMRELLEAYQYAAERVKLSILYLRCPNIWLRELVLKW